MTKIIVLNKINKIFPEFFKLLFALISKVWSILHICIDFILYTSDKYNELVLVLIGGELTLITLFFALIPTLVDKRNDQYYLGYKISEIFLYGNGKKSELAKTWIGGIILASINIIFCLLKLDNLSFFCFTIFILFFTFKILKYLNFISNGDEIKIEIEKNFVKEGNSNYSSLIQNMVDTSKDSMKNIYDNMNFLFKINEDSRFLNDYTNKLLDIKNINQDSIYFKISEFIEEKKYNYYFKFDYSKLYKYLRNSINDFNKEDYYGFIHTLLINNYNCYINKQMENMDVLVLPIFRAIDDSKLSANNRQNLKNRIINNMNIYIKKEYIISDKEYLYVYKYEFYVLKYIVDNKDLNLFNKFIRNNDSNYTNYGIIYDLYLTCFLYLYYLIEIETEKYVSSADKKIYKEMYNQLCKAFDIYNFELNNYYYRNFNAFFKNLNKVTNWWEKFNLEDQWDVKTCLVDSSIIHCKKALFIIFGKDFIGKKYSISDEIVNLFKNDFENGILKIQSKEQLKSVLLFFNYNINDELEKFEEDFLEFVSNNYKIDELSKKIDIENLSKKLNNELSIIKEKINKLSIINNKKCSDFEECFYNINCSKDFLDSFYANKNLLNDLNLESALEKYVYECILSKVENKIYHSYIDDKIIVDTLDKIKSKYFYFRPSNDLLGEKWKFGNKYKNIISRYELVDTSISKIRILVKDYNCSIVNVSLELKEVTDDFIKSKLRSHFISRNKYCIKNEFGLEIFFTKQEFLNYLKNTEVLLQIKIKFGLDIFGNKNIAFIRKKDS